MNERIQNRVAGLLGSLFVTAIVVTLGIVGFSPTNAVSGPRWAGSSGGGVASGGAGTFNTLTVTNLTPTEVLFAGPGGAVTDSPNLTFTNPTTSPLLTVGSGTTTAAGVQMGYSGTSGISGIWQTGVTPTASNANIYLSGANTIVASAQSGGRVYFRPGGSSSTTSSITLGAGAFNPENDGTVTIGASGARFSSAFLGSSTAITASAPAIDVAQTWNNAAVAFTAAKVNVTNTASAAGSLLQDWQVGGISALSVGFSGTNGVLNFGSTSNQLANNGGNLGFKSNGGSPMNFSLNSVIFNAGGVQGWPASGASGAFDTGLARNAAGVVEVNNGTAGTFASIVAANYIGTTTNNNAAAGSIGEYITSSVASSGAIVMNSGTPITTVSTGATVTAGDYDAQGTACYSTAIATSITVLEQGISTSNNTFSTLGSYTSDQFAAMVPLATGTNEICRSTPTVRISLSGTSTVFLVTRGVFTVSTLSSYGFLRLRRVR